MIQWGEGNWKEVFRKQNILRLENDDDVIWFSLPQVITKSCIVETRKSGIDQWWPSWNLATDGFIIEGEQVDTETIPITQSIEKDLLTNKCDLINLPMSIEAKVNDHEVRYKSKFLEAGFRLKRTGFSYFSMDETGCGKTQDNMLQIPQLAISLSENKKCLTQGICLHPVGSHET